MADKPVFNNFDLHIGRASDHSYHLSVLYSPAGETAEPVAVYFDARDATLVAALAALRAAAIPRAELIALGRRLTGFLLPPGQVRDLYQRSLGLTEARGLNLRLRLRIAPEELAALPWEYAFDDSINDFFVLNPRTALVRYHSEQVAPLSVASYAPVPLLLVAAGPTGFRPLAVTEEIRNLLDALAPFLRAQRVTVDILCGAAAEVRGEIAQSITGLPGVRLLAGAADLDGLRSALRQGYRVLHYIGHGGFDPQVGGALVLGRDDGRPVVVGSQALARELRGSSVAVLLLNACESAMEDTGPALMGLAPNLVRAGLPAVIAMQYALPDASALDFSRALYQALADGWPLDAAVTEGRKAISSHESENGIAWGIPVLFMRAPDGVIWQEAPAAETPTAASGGEAGKTVFYGPTSFGGDFVAGDKVIRGDEVRGDIPRRQQDQNGK